jgi:hypothetical protein
MVGGLRAWPARFYPPASYPSPEPLEPPPRQGERLGEQGERPIRIARIQAGDARVNGFPGRGRGVVIGRSPGCERAARRRGAHREVYAAGAAGSRWPD